MKNEISICAMAAAGLALFGAYNRSNAASEDSFARYQAAAYIPVSEQAKFTRAGLDFDAMNQMGNGELLDLMDYVTAQQKQLLQELLAYRLRYQAQQAERQLQQQQRLAQRRGQRGQLPGQYQEFERLQQRIEGAGLDPIILFSSDISNLLSLFDREHDPERKSIYRDLIQLRMDQETVPVARARPVTQPGSRVNILRGVQQALVDHGYDPVMLTQMTDANIRALMRGAANDEARQLLQNYLLVRRRNVNVAER